MSISISNFDNGLTLIVEPMPHVQSAAYSLSIPVGIVSDLDSQIGSSLLLVEMTSRGAGKYSSRELSEAFESLGVRHSEGAGLHISSFNGSLIAEKLEAALELVAMMVKEPHLNEDELENIRKLAIQDIQSLDDNPSRKVMVELNARFFPGPYGRSSMGTIDGLNSCNIESIKNSFEERFGPNGSILSVAGNVNVSEVERVAKRLFGGWIGKTRALPEFGSLPPMMEHHIEVDSAQLQIALAYPSVALGSDGYYAARVLNGVLSGGMFGRLFIEVREKRGLCYSVYSSHACTSLFGAVKAYAGTTPERAQETLDVLVAELRNVKGTINDDELARAKANMKSSLVMSEESSGSRAASNASDWYWLKKVRTLEEILASIDKVSSQDIDRHIEQYPPAKMSLVTLGSKQLKFPN
ncbi:MAG: insulinase family protein [Bdellovibrionales bacterium]|nr:insulinase family protein [Bdellovibrionales bacterium]